MKVLIVDDTPANLRLLRAVLEGEKIEVVEAADGAQGLSILRREPVDAIISDILMPNMDGYRFCREVRRSETLHHLPFVVYSSTYNSPSDEKLALTMGVDRFVKKPSPIQEIVGVLNEVISRGPHPPESVEPERELGLAKLYNETLVNKLEQKNVELFEQAQALRASEEKFRQLAENINEFCWIASADTMETLYASPAYEKIWGRPCQALYDNPLSFMDGIPAADRESVAAAMEAMKCGSPIDLEHRVVRADGELRWVHVRGAGVRNEAGEIYRIVGICEDITRRKSTEDQLRQAQKMEAIGQLAGGVAHDFNNLLTIIGANLELVMMTEKNFGPDSREYLGQVSHAADRAATLTRQLLAFSRSEAMNLQVVNLNELVATFGKLLGRILGEDVRLVADLAPALPLVKVDPGMIEQVLMNLSVNARDAMPAGGRLTICTELQVIDASYVQANPRSRAGRFACINVEDIGTGIAPEHMSRIFEPFFTTKGVGKGTGLGLATVFGIAEQHGGWVEVQSQLGMGTTFRVFIPVTTEGITATDTAHRKKTAGRGERILVAEDDRSVRAVMGEILRRQGYTVFEADSGISARQLWLQEGGRFDLLLTDMVMTGGVTGLELAEMLRMETPGLKVVLTSGYSSVLVSNDVLATKKLAFLKKPFSPQALAETIRRNLDAQETSQP